MISASKADQGARLHQSCVGLYYIQGEEMVGVVWRWARVGAVLQVQTVEQSRQMKAYCSEHWTLWWL